MEVVSIDRLREGDYLYFFKTVYNDRPYISLHALRMKPAVSFGVTASDVTMRAFMSLLPTAGVGRRLHTKTSPTGPIIVKVVDLSPYLDQLYVRIAEEPSITLQRLSAYFVADRCKFFNPIALKLSLIHI